MMNPKIDSLTKRMLGVQNDDEVSVVPGQKADPNRLSEAREQRLLYEACEFGDILVKYVGARKLSYAQRAWGAVLALLCQRADYPDGLETFDEISKRGEAELSLDCTSDVEMTEEQLTNALEKIDEDALNGAALFAEVFSKYISMKKHQMGLSNPQAAYGLGRAFKNLQLVFPNEHGGSKAFDEYGRQAGEYFDRNRE